MISAAFFCAHFGGKMELKRLSNKFYSVYNKKDYPNILRKIKIKPKTITTTNIHFFFI